MVRKASGLLQIARAMRVLANLSGERPDLIEEKLERAIGLSQHHGRYSK